MCPRHSLGNHQVNRLLWRVLDPHIGKAHAAGGYGVGKPSGLRGRREGFPARLIFAVAESMPLTDFVLFSGVALLASGIVIAVAKAPRRSDLLPRHKSDKARIA